MVPTRVSTSWVFDPHRLHLFSILILPYVFGANRSLLTECSLQNIPLYYLNLLLYSFTFHFLCHISHDNRI